MKKDRYDLNPPGVEGWKYKIYCLLWISRRLQWDGAALDWDWL